MLSAGGSESWVNQQAKDVPSKKTKPSYSEVVTKWPV